MSVVCFTIPGLPPSVNHCYRNDRFGRRHYTPEAVAYFDEILHVTFIIKMLPDGGVSVKVEFAVWLKDRRRRDLDNMLKVLCDGLQKAGVIEDDSQIRDMRIYEAGLDRKNPRVEVKLEVLR